jgi:hypothetical protein
MAELVGFEWDLKHFWDWIFFGGNSEKGSIRKRTENRVTSWTKLFWGNFGILR